MDETPSQTALRERLRAVGMALFRREGLRFTMQEAARAIHISKKTIYAVYPSKLTAAQKTTLATVNALFSGILLTSDDPGRYTPRHAPTVRRRARYSRECTGCTGQRGCREWRG